MNCSHSHQQGDDTIDSSNTSNNNGKTSNSNGTTTSGTTSCGQQNDHVIATVTNPLTIHSNSPQFQPTKKNLDDSELISMDLNQNESAPFQPAQAMTQAHAFTGTSSVTQKEPHTPIDDEREFLLTLQDKNVLPPPHTLSIKEVTTQFHTNAEHGLSTTQAQERIQLFGRNELKSQGGINLWKLLAFHLFTFMNLILAVAMVISFAVTEWVDGGVVAFIIVLNIIIGVLQEYRSEKSMQKLKRMQHTFTKVVRSGTHSEIPSHQLTLGDVIMLDEGDHVPADCRLIYTAQLECMEAILTGESEPVKKNANVIFAQNKESARITVPQASKKKKRWPTSRRSSIAETPTTTDARKSVNDGGVPNTSFDATNRTSIFSLTRPSFSVLSASEGKPHHGKQPVVDVGDRINMVFSGTTVTRGKGRAVVAAIGMQTEIGAIAQSISKHTRQRSKLQKRMALLGLVLVIAGAICTGLVILAAYLHKSMPLFPDALTVGVSTAIAIIPEGLSPVLTLTMTIGVMRMAKQHAIVRKLDSIETLGNVTDICSDKTGTISEGVMAVKECILSNDMVFQILGDDIEMKEVTKTLQAAHTSSTSNNVTNSAMETASAAVPAKTTPKLTSSSPLVLVDIGLKQRQDQMDTLSQAQPTIVTTDYINQENDLLKTFLMISSMCNGCSLSKGNVEVTTTTSKRKKRGNIFKRVKEFKKKKIGKTSPHELKPLKSGEPGSEEEELYVGDPTEIALMTLAQQYGLGKKHLERSDSSTEATSIEEELQEYDSTQLFTLFQEYPFDSNLKRMSVIYTKRSKRKQSTGEETETIETNNDDRMEDDEYIFVKGAPEHVLNFSTHYYTSEKHVGVNQWSVTNHDSSNEDSKQTVAPVTQRYLDHLRRQNELLAKKGLRVLALAFRKREHLPHLLSNSTNATTSENTLEHEKTQEENPKDEKRPLLTITSSTTDTNYYERSQVEKDLIFVGLVGIQDPPRQGVKESISICHQAGITVRMITGDHKATAVAIAKQVGMVTPELLASPQSNQIAMNAHDFDALTDEELRNLKELPIIISRCSPESKERMIHALHQRKRGTVMCGDGINDCPSIKAADVGIAMGKSGSDVVKDCADIVLTDDNFSTIVVAVKEGRHMFENIRKFVSHLLAGNVSETILLVVSLLIGLKPPLNSIQILWLNMITGTGPAFGLGNEKPRKGIMTKSYSGKLFAPETIIDIFFFGSLMGLLSLASFLIATKAMNVPLQEAQTITFVTSTVLLLLHAYNCRNSRRPFFLDGFYNSRLLHFFVLFGAVTTISTVYIPWVNSNIFHQTMIPAFDWIIVLLAALIFMGLSEIYKCCKRILLVTIVERIRNYRRHGLENIV
ncbi:hypothetical protein C9374_009079 [Naegleria lovaniensis]|uniref:Cation-transporting P-type ATPase N-terminal domain-containing protein n=1 Tax=Naegleria lovaniensis TaxID=51637 RepID=A0AA88KH83_NAELO|nr:uncharacterized protein C9374_009079 [Naegleria lovaniensis]KAG2377563.1 hypothetical protein C9374_009079 [Naegleria lovaniensis]